MHYNSTARNSLGDLVQFVYGEDSMDGAFIEHQYIKMFTMNDQEFEHKYCVDVMDTAEGFFPGILLVGVDDSSIGLQQKLNEEYDQLVQDRKLLCEFIYPECNMNTTHYLPVNLHHFIQNACQIFHIDRHKPSDLESIYIVDAIQQLSE